MGIFGGGGGSSGGGGVPEIELPDIPPMPETATQAEPPGFFSRQHAGQITPHTSLAMAHTQRPIDFRKAGMLQQMAGPNLGQLLFGSMKGSFGNVAQTPPPAPPQPVAPAPAQPDPFPHWRATSDYDIAMNDDIDPYPWRTDYANSRRR